MEILKNRGPALVFVFFLYLIAFAAGVFVFHWYYGSGALFATFAGDLAATIVVWIAGAAARNSSLYDPYWSAAPVVIIPCWILLKESPVSSVDILFLLAVLFWGIRLTWNWATGWVGIGQQDWRYKMLKKSTGRKWFIVNLMGINIMPTVLVFFGMVPAYYGIFDKGRAGLISVLGFIICIAAAIIQYYADKQMREFRGSADVRTRCIDRGLWRFSRHPNYFGEVSFWAGIWLIQIGAIPSLWKTAVGPVLIALLFIFISIPMMEQHVLASRPDYAQYRNKVSMLIPWFRKEKSAERI
ncbi:MAG: DUF1295 domain-containing protein [Bacillota bacterium]|nr:DUF1295 domain-containing protein [Bacillota bacterium]